jgi:hypothetical protein
MGLSSGLSIATTLRSSVAQSLGGRSVGGDGGGGGGPTFDADALSRIEAIEAADGQSLEPAVRLAINEFVLGCKADPSVTVGVSNWQAIREGCLMMGARTLAGALVPFVGGAPTNTNFVPEDYSRTAGLAGNGTNKMLTSAINNNFGPPANRHACVFRSVSETRDATRSAIASGTFSTDVQLITTSTMRFFRVIDTSNTPTLSESTAVPGFYGATRVNDVITGRYNGTNTNFTVATTTSFNSNNFQIFARNSTNYSNASIVWWSVGEAIDLIAMDSRLAALRTALISAGISDETLDPEESNDAATFDSAAITFDSDTHSFDAELV